MLSGDAECTTLPPPFFLHQATHQYFLPSWLGDIFQLQSNEVPELSQTRLLLSINLGGRKMRSCLLPSQSRDCFQATLHCIDTMFRKGGGGHPCIEGKLLIDTHVPNQTTMFHIVWLCMTFLSSLKPNLLKFPFPRPFQFFFD